MPTVAELMIFLWKSEGVSTLNVEELYVHWIHDDGTITELVAIDNKDKIEIEQEAKPTVRRRPSNRTLRRRQIAESLMIGSFNPPSAADRDDCDIVPWPAEVTGMFDEEEDWFLNKVTEILVKVKAHRERPTMQVGVPISQGLYTSYPAAYTE